MSTFPIFAGKKWWFVFVSDALHYSFAVNVREFSYSHTSYYVERVSNEIESFLWLFGVPFATYVFKPCTHGFIFCSYQTRTAENIHINSKSKVDSSESAQNIYIYFMKLVFVSRSASHRFKYCSLCVHD